MSTYDYDLFTIGAGSGGVRASRIAASYGAKVAVAEERFLGGTCVNVGCVPKKLFSYGAHFHEDFGDAAGYGWTVGETKHDWKTLVQNKNTEISRLNGIYEGLLSNAGVDLFEGRATIVDAHTVRVNGQDISAKYILIATGGKPSRPTEPGQELGYVSDDLFYLEERPQRMLVAGGGYIAVEFAGIFNGLGSDVTQIYRGPMFLRGFDGDVRSFLAQEMQKKGINLLFNQIIEKTEKSSNGLVAHFTDGSQQEYDAIFYAIGRTPNVDGLGLENTNVKLNKKGAIIVDEYFQTTEPSIYALGDVIGRVQLTPVAIAEGMALAANLFKGAKQKVDYADIPTAVFSHPTIGTVGLTEEQAREQFGSVDVYYSDFRPMKHTMSGRNERSMMKLIVDQTSDRVLGAHMVGLDAPEIVQGLGIALKAGATKAQFDATIGIHPTAAEEFVTMRTKRPEPSAEQVAAAQ